MIDTIAKRESRIEIVQCLRGLAALSVCWFHFTNGNPHFLAQGWLKSSGQYGWLGVEIFFVLSGFVVPYSLARAGYVWTMRNYGQFLWKRISRLDPPYVASIVLVLTLGYVAAFAPGYRGSSTSFSVLDILAHIGYLNAFLHKPWLNVVYWSLAIEFQYYLLIGLLFPLLLTNRRAHRVLLLSGLALGALVVPGEGLIFRFLFLFIMGFSVFQRRLGVIGRLELLVTLVIAVIGTSITIGAISAATGFATSAIILGVEYSNRILDLFGQVSYSLYLVHVPIGGRIINIGDRIGGGLATKAMFLILAMACSLTVACAFYRWIELPFRRYSSRLSFADNNLRDHSRELQQLGRSDHASSIALSVDVQC